MDQRRRSNALDVAAVGDQVEIGLEDLVLAVAGFQPDGREDLFQLAGRAARVDVVEAPRELHGDGRAAQAPSARQDRAHGARQGKRVHTGMKAKPTILVDQRRLHGQRRDGREWRPQPHLCVVGKGHAQQFPAAAVDRARRRNPSRDRRMRRHSKAREQECQSQQNHPASDPDIHHREHIERKGRKRTDPRSEDPFPSRLSVLCVLCGELLHGLVMVRLPGSPRARVERSYMDSAWTAGVTTLPALVALIL